MKNQIIAKNRRASHDYFLEDNYEAGLVLEGWEVKSLRSGHLQLNESFIDIQDGEAFLHGAHIAPLLSASSHVTPIPNRKRKLLLNKSELNALSQAISRKGFTAVPVSVYWKKGRAKLALALAKGKHKHDKRAAQKDSDWKMEKAKMMKSTSRG